MMFIGNKCVMNEASYPTLVLPDGECAYIDEEFQYASVTQADDGRIQLRGYCDDTCTSCEYQDVFGPGVCVEVPDGNYYMSVQPVQDTALTVTVYNGRSCEYDGESVTRNSNECGILPDNYVSLTSETAYTAVALDGGWAMLEWECVTNCPVWGVISNPGCPFRKRVEVNQCLPLQNGQSILVTYQNNIGMWIGLSVAAAVLLFVAILALSIWWSRKKQAQATAAGGLDEKQNLLVATTVPSITTEPDSGAPQFSYAQLPASGYSYNYSYTGGYGSGGYGGGYGGSGAMTSGDDAGAAYAAYPPVEPGTYPSYPPTPASPTAAGGSAEGAL